LEICGDFLVPTKQAALIQVPTLLATGEKSSYRMRKAAEAAAQAISTAHHVSLPKQNHAVAAKALAPILVQFFTEGYA
jgi:pimeloyl-ACP methyl ester carboxylesterase